MAMDRLTRGDELLSSWPNKKVANIKLQRHNVSLAVRQCPDLIYQVTLSYRPAAGADSMSPKLDIPESAPGTRQGKSKILRDATEDTLTLSSAVLQAHAVFKAEMQPDQTSTEVFDRRCRAEVKTIALFFPGALSDRIRICFSAWLAYACAMDDILETLPAEEAQAVLYDCIGIVQGRPPPGAEAADRDTRIQRMAQALYKHCTQQLTWPTCLVFFREVSAVLYAHIDEIYFLDGRIPCDLPAYMSIRGRTISLNPFFEVIKWEYLPSHWRLSALWEGLQNQVSCAAGLQNDLIGLEKDLEAGEQLNAVALLLRMNGKDAHEDSSTSSRDEEEEHLARCVGLAVAEHNKSVAQVLTRVAQMHRASRGALPDTVLDVMRHIVLLCETHLRWVTSSKRYRVVSD